MALTEDEKAALNAKLQSEIEHNVITDLEGDRINSLHDHMKRAYINGASSDQALSMKQYNAMVFNKMCTLSESAEIDVETIYNDAMLIKNVHQAKAFNSGKFNDIVSVLDFCRYVNPITGVEDPNHEVVQVRADIVAYVPVDVASRFEWLSQGLMLSTIKKLKKTSEDSSLSDDDINTALRFDKEYNITALPILSALYGKPHYGTAEYNAVIEKALNFDYYSQVTLLEFLLKNVVKAGGFVVSRPDDGSEVSEEVLLDIKSRKDALVSTAESMTPEYPLMTSLINKTLSETTSNLQYIAEQNANKTVRIYTNKEFVEGDSSNIRSKTELTEQEVQKITLDTYNTWMKVINQGVFSGVDLSSILQDIYDSNFGVTGGGDEETKEVPETTVSSVQEEGDPHIEEEEDTTDTGESTAVAPTPTEEDDVELVGDGGAA